MKQAEFGPWTPNMKRRRRGSAIGSLIGAITLAVAVVGVAGLVGAKLAEGYVPELPSITTPQDVATSVSFPQPGIKAVTYYTIDGDKCRLWLQEDKLIVARCAWRGELERAAYAAKRVAEEMAK